MKPRVFVSSTYYDLKYVRENLEKFIKKFNFEPVLSETGTITFEHGKELDDSCYEAVKQCHMMILIIGGRYGSAASSDKHRKKYDSEYVSVTRKEVETAFEMNLPVFIFIDKNVNAEYKTFIENRDVKGIKYAHVDNVNVFKFIDTLMGRAMATFEKIEEIEEYLDNQIAGMFYLYLQGLQKERTDSRILDSVEELKKITKVMNEMLNKVGQKTISEEDYNEAIRKQNEILLEYFGEIFDSTVHLNPSMETFQNNFECAEKIYQVYAKNLFENEALAKATIDGGPNTVNDYTAIQHMHNSIQRELKRVNGRLNSDVLSFPLVKLYFKDIYSQIKGNPKLRDKFKKVITGIIASQLNPYAL